MPATVLFELTELASYVQSDLDEASATLARDDATALIKAYTRQQLFKSETTDSLPRDEFDASRLWLPQLPVDTNETITAVGETSGTYTDVYTRGQWLYRGTAGTGPDGAWDEYVTVTYTHGFDTIPDFVASVARGVAARILANPLGVRSRTIGAMSVTNAGSDADLVSGAFLTDRERAMLSPLRRARFMQQVS